MDTKVSRRCVFFGFGTVAKSCVPLVIDMLSEEISSFLIVDQYEPSEENLAVFKTRSSIPVNVHKHKFDPEFLVRDISSLIKDNDMVFDLTNMLDTVTVMLTVARKKNILYVNACIEEWDEGVDKDNIAKTLYELYDKVYSKKDEINKNNCTLVCDAGANPGASTHFAVMALYGMAKSAIERRVHDADLITSLLAQNNIPELATALGVEVIHVSELEQISPSNPEYWKNKTISTWALDSFLEEWFFQGEAAVGSEDDIGKEDECKRRCKEQKRGKYEFVEASHPPAVQIPFPIHMNSVIGNKTKYVGRVIRHPETMEISSLFWDKKTNHTVTCVFVYRPSAITLGSFDNPRWEHMPREILSERTGGPLKGQENMGITLISSREDIPARWYGSSLTCEEARRVKCTTSPTILQVAAGVVGHMVMASRHAHRGLVMPHDFDSREMVGIMAPYLGSIIDEDVEVRLPTKWSELLADSL